MLFSDKQNYIKDTRLYHNLFPLEETTKFCLTLRGKKKSCYWIPHHINFLFCLMAWLWFTGFLYETQLNIEFIIFMQFLCQIYIVLIQQGSQNINHLLGRNRIMNTSP